MQYLQLLVWQGSLCSNDERMRLRAVAVSGGWSDEEDLAAACRQCLWGDKESGFQWHSISSSRCLHLGCHCPCRRHLISFTALACRLFLPLAGAREAAAASADQQQHQWDRGGSQTKPVSQTQLLVYQGPQTHKPRGTNKGRRKGRSEEEEEDQEDASKYVGSSFSSSSWRSSIWKRGAWW